MGIDLHVIIPEDETRESLQAMFEKEYPNNDWDVMGCRAYNVWMYISSDKPPHEGVLDTRTLEVILAQMRLIAIPPSLHYAACVEWLEFLIAHNLSLELG